MILYRCIKLLLESQVLLSNRCALFLSPDFIRQWRLCVHDPLLLYSTLQLCWGPVSSSVNLCSLIMTNCGSQSDPSRQCSRAECYSCNNYWLLIFTKSHWWVSPAVGLCVMFVLSQCVRRQLCMCHSVDSVLQCEHVVTSEPGPAAAALSPLPPLISDHLSLQLGNSVSCFSDSVSLQIYSVLSVNLMFANKYSVYPSLIYLLPLCHRAALKTHQWATL